MLDIDRFFDRIKDKQILVLGDVMLDEYYFSDVERISPEAPIPVAHVKSIERRLGGAANVANNLAHLGANVILIGQVGLDSDAEVYEKLLDESNIQHYLIKRKDFSTIRKIRIISQNQQMLRVDFEQPKKITSKEVKEIRDFLSKESFDIILLSDYNKGFFTRELVEMLKNFGKKILVDPKPQNIDLFKGVYAMFPNEIELNKIIPGDLSYVEKGKLFVKKFDSNLFLTRGSKGAAIFTKDGTFSEIPAEAKSVYDVTGAGDTFFAVCSLALSENFDFFTSAMLANTAAGIVVSKIGTSVVEPDELKSAFIHKNPKIKSVEELKEIMKLNKDKTFVFTNGCFDILHPGHIRLLREAKKQGDFLIVALNSDESVRKLKGEGRPIMPLEDRMEVISSLAFVDFVTHFSEDTPERIILELKPQVHVKGGDYDPNDLTKMPEARIVKSYGGRIHIVPLLDGKSTTNIIKKAKKNE